MPCAGADQDGKPLTLVFLTNAWSQVRAAVLGYLPERLWNGILTNTIKKTDE
jgi:hypothetical protein